MKKLLQLGAVILGVFAAQYGYADAPTRQMQQMKAPASQPVPAPMTSERAPMMNNSQEMGACPADHPCEDQKLNDCWCLYVHYEPCYYTEKRCVEESVPCKKRCCRYVTKSYDVQRCKYVPQYYTETLCREEPEYYDVDDCKVCKKWVCDTKCKYVPKYYWKHTCDQGAACPNKCQ
jgi:hypothetical protein